MLFSIIIKWHVHLHAKFSTTPLQFLPRSYEQKCWDFNSMQKKIPIVVCFEFCKKTWMGRKIISWQRPWYVVFFFVAWMINLPVDIRFRFLCIFRDLDVIRLSNNIRKDGLIFKTVRLVINQFATQPSKAMFLQQYRKSNISWYRAFINQ